MNKCVKCQFNFRSIKCLTFSNFLVLCVSVINVLISSYLVIVTLSLCWSGLLCCCRAATEGEHEALRLGAGGARGGGGGGLHKREHKTWIIDFVDYLCRCRYYIYSDYRVS